MVEGEFFTGAVHIFDVDWKSILGWTAGVDGVLVVVCEPAPQH
jgi:hypothetical protein